MDALLPDLKEYFDPLQDRFERFAKFGVQLEGWFKGELLNALDELKEEGRIQRIDREVKVGSGRVDLTLDIDGTRNWIELKHWLIGKQKDTQYRVNFYFADRHVGIATDVDKLVNAGKPRDVRWMLLLLTANTNDQEWEKGIALFNQKFSPNRISSATQPNQFPKTYFLGLLKVED